MDGFTSPSESINENWVRITGRQQVDCDELACLLPGGAGEYLRVGAGGGKGSITRIDFPGVHLLVTDISNRIVFRGATAV